MKMRMPDQTVQMPELGHGSVAAIRFGATAGLHLARANAIYRRDLIVAMVEANGGEVPIASFFSELRPPLNKPVDRRMSDDTLNWAIDAAVNAGLLKQTEGGTLRFIRHHPESEHLKKS